MEAAGKVNVYTCDQCGAKHVTVNTVEGVTPFMIDCRHESEGRRCRGRAYSALYRCDQNQAAGWEWYRPTEKEAGQLDKGLRDHIERGGLLLRQKSVEAGS